MSLLNIYIIVSTFAMLYVAIIWPSRGILLITAKIFFIVITFVGLIMTTKVLSPMLGF
jgi:hypothetical protein